MGVGRLAVCLWREDGMVVGAPRVLALIVQVVLTHTYTDRHSK